MDALERERGWRSSLSEHGLVAREPLVSDWSPSSGYRIGLELLDGPAFTAVFAGNDETALGLIARAAGARRERARPGERGRLRRHPEAEHLHAAAHDRAQDFGELGRNIMSTLVDILRDEPRS